jgi:lipopolysaccharide transport system permease protein
MQESILGTNDSWDLVIEPKKNVYSLNLKSIWNYRDLLMLFVRRDFVSVFKQTILGPLWFVIQPLFTTLIYTIVFGNLANLATDGIPQPVFYLSGIILWNYFSECLMKISDTFMVNQALFGKVYFPRMVVPLSIVISTFLKFGVQLLLFICVYLYFFFNGAVAPNVYILLLPLLVVNMAGLGLALGLIVSSLTTKYKDLKFLIQFGVQLAMYASPIVYPLSVVPEKYKLLLVLNPATGVIETFRFALFKAGEFNLFAFGYSFLVMIFLLFVGIIFFNKNEKSFIDTV